MAEKKEFVYSTTKVLGNVNEKSLEIGHYTVDGKANADKVYLVSTFTRRNGDIDSKATPICNIDEAKEIAKLLINL